MIVRTRWVAAVLVSMVLAVASTPPARAQVGKSLGVVDANTASEADLAKNTFLIGQGLTQEQAMEFYQKAFIHINLNTATPEEILLVPGAGKRMVREFAEYRPWKSWAQFDKEIGKYVGADGAAKLAQYCFIPVNLNTASDEDILSIPGAGPRMVREFKEYRPWKSWAQFDKEIGKYVGQKETDRLKRYVVIE